MGGTEGTDAGLLNTASSDPGGCTKPPSLSNDLTQPPSSCPWLGLETKTSPAGSSPPSSKFRHVCGAAPKVTVLASRGLAGCLCVYSVGVPRAQGREAATASAATAHDPSTAQGCQVGRARRAGAAGLGGWHRGAARLEAAVFSEQTFESEQE